MSQALVNTRPSRLRDNPKSCLRLPGGTADFRVFMIVQNQHSTKVSEFRVGRIAPSISVLWMQEQTLSRYPPNFLTESGRLPDAINSAAAVLSTSRGNGQLIS